MGDFGDEDPQGGFESAEVIGSGDPVDELQGGEGQDSFSTSQSESSDDGMQVSVLESSPPEEERSWVPVKKVVQVPFFKNGILINAVYLARPGDDLTSVSQRIYGTGSRSSELLKANSTLSRGLKTGDKIYYNSPQRPNDKSKFSLYYEERGIVPKIYRSQYGDNIRVVSKRLLGDEGSWKEIWATNLFVESKGEIPEGTELRYWPDMGVGTTVAGMSNKIIESEELPPSWSEDLQEPKVAAVDVAFSDNEAPPSSPEDMDVAVQNNNVPPPAAEVFTADSMPHAQADEVAVKMDVPSTPPPSSEPLQQEARADLAVGQQAILPTPEAPPSAVDSPSQLGIVTEKAAGGGGDSSIQWMIGMALLLLGVILVFIIIRKRKRAAMLNQDIDFNTAISSVGHMEEELQQVEPKKRKRAI